MFSIFINCVRTMLFLCHFNGSDIMVIRRGALYNIPSDVIEMSKKKCTIYVQLLPIN